MENTMFMFENLEFTGKINKLLQPIRTSSSFNSCLEDRRAWKGALFPSFEFLWLFIYTQYILFIQLAIRTIRKERTNAIKEPCNRYSRTLPLP